MYHAKNKYIVINNNKMHYLTFGTGNKWLILIPGLSLQRFKGKSQEMSFFYRQFAKDYQVLMFDRKDSIEKDYSIEDMADELYQALNKLEIKKADIVGISQGGMIAQWLAADFPERVEKLILTVTTAKLNNLGRERITRWLELSQTGAYKELMLDIASHSYTPKSFGKFKYLYRIMGIFGRIKDKQRIAIQTISCLRHDSLAVLEKINCPTLVIGAEEDDVLGVEASLELHQHIKDSQLTILPDCGHALYEEHKDFQKRVLLFLES